MRRETNVIYVGFFIPNVKHILITDRGLQAETSKETYKTIKRGDTVTMIEQSDGVYRVDH